MTADTKTETPADELREAASRLRGESADTTPGPWRRHDTHLDRGGHTATVLTNRTNINDTELVAWLPSRSNEPWADHPCWSNSRWIALVHPGLAEPLASWLEETADAIDRVSGYDLPLCCEPTHTRSGRVHLAECDCRARERGVRPHGLSEPCPCFAHPLAVARAVNGSAPSGRDAVRAAPGSPVAGVEGDPLPA